MNDNLAMGFLAGILFLIILFLIFREIVTWYWKINRRIEILESIALDVQFIADKLDPEKKRYAEEIKEAESNPD